MAAALGRPPSLANGCFAIRSRADARFVAIAGADAYRANKLARARATPFYFKPTGFGTYLLLDGRGKLLAVDAAAAVRRAGSPASSPNGRCRAARGGAYSVRSESNGRGLVVKPATGEQGVTAAGGAARGQRFQFEPARGAAVPRGDGRRVRGSAQTHQPRRNGLRIRGPAPPHHRGAPRRRSRHPRQELRPVRNRGPWAVTSWITGPTGVSTSSAT